ncbi:hypothetical protein CH333_05005 [candidate division WOR-3 bacterium JGI_Cruoil_03_44_89]|uniref:HEPN domain-containing protein n=1 Tax=candidate division WOR-3 bacterium JGI_Cruoil_03_44_89 TaxID=1973748 RepID=A0A235BW32_UNCW3|nr:MAG: hypothetical protein CH333_05005 [candidate division WOR-3 bacterium JGI_Cruoil_03_44_89]
MTRFEKRYFVKFDFSDKQLGQYLTNALRDLEIALENERPEVKFNYSYTALIKGGIALIARIGKVKARSIPGHHIKIIEKMSEILQDETIKEVANSMRMKRNIDLYSGGIFVSDKESKDFYNFTEKVLLRIKKTIERNKAKESF